MSDVEKYGLLALVFVLGVLGLILVYGGDDGALAQADLAPQPVVIRKPSEALPAPARSSGNAPRMGPRAEVGPRAEAADQRPMRAYKVESLVADRGPFAFDEPPVAYPGERSMPARLVSAEGRVYHTIEAGETLSDVSRRHFDTPNRWRDIVALNPGLDPKKLQVGMTILVAGPPPARQAAVVAASSPPVTAAPVAAAPVAAALVAAAEPAPPAGPRTYVVQKGDTLGAIAQREMGSAKRSQALFEANKDLLSSPDKLKPGMQLRIP